MDGHADGKDFTNKQVILWQVLADWEDAVEDYRTNYETLEQTIEQFSSSLSDLTKLRDQSIEHLEEFLSQTSTELSEDTPDNVISELKEHIAILQSHNQKVTDLLRRLTSR